MSLSHEELSELTRRAKDDPSRYWAEAAKELDWTKEWTQVLDDTQPPFTKWFPGGELNVCYNCVDRHVEAGRGDRTAFIFDSPVTQTRKDYTFLEIQDHVTRLGSVLISLGVRKQDVVMIYTPNTPEGAFAMLACARIGAIHACVPSGLPAKDLAPRIDHSKPKVILMSSWGYHADGWMNYKNEIDQAYDTASWKPEKILVLQRDIKEKVSLVDGRDHDWIEMVSQAGPSQCVPVEANDPVFMVYTSGSTGAPKAIVHAAGSYAVRMVHDTPIYFGSGDEQNVVLATSSFGWIAGLSFVVYGPLIIALPSVVFEGEPLLTGDVRGLYRLLADNKVTVGFIRPGIFKLLKGMDPDGQIGSEYDFSSLRYFLVGGERVDMKTMEWVTRVFGTSIWNAWGQSEACSVVTGIPDKSLENGPPGVHDFGAISVGWNFYIQKHDGSEAKPSELGRILARLPLPPGGLLTIFENEEQCRKVYFEEFPGFYDTKDEGYLNEKGQLRVESRVDDIMKVGQVYISAQAIEEVVLAHDGVAECVVVSTTDLIWKEIPVALYVKKTDSNHAHEEVCRDLAKMVFDKFGISVKFGGAILVRELPMTRTGKVHRPSCNALARGKTIQSSGAVENSYVFEDLARALRDADYGKNVLMD